MTLRKPLALVATVGLAGLATPAWADGFSFGLSFGNGSRYYSSCGTRSYVYYDRAPVVYADWDPGIVTYGRAPRIDYVRRSCEPRRAVVYRDYAPRHHRTTRVYTTRSHRHVRRDCGVYRDHRRDRHHRSYRIHTSPRHRTHRHDRHHWRSDRRSHHGRPDRHRRVRARW